MMFNFKGSNNQGTDNGTAGSSVTTRSHQSHNDPHNDGAAQTSVSPSSKSNQKKMTGNNNSNRKSKRSRRRRKGRKSAQIEPMTPHQQSSAAPHDAPMTKSDLYFALDCEMVGIGPEGFDSAVARVTIVNWDGVVVLDTFVKIPVQVTDYRTHVSGIQPEDVQREDAMSFPEVSKAVQEILRGKILIGHGLENDLCALGLTHPWCDVRDTARYAPYMLETTVGTPERQQHPGSEQQPQQRVLRPRRLRDLAWSYLGRAIQTEGVPHSPVEDATAALDLYKAARVEWEEELSRQQKERIKIQEQQEAQVSSRGWFSPPSIFTTTPPGPQHAVYPPPSHDPRLPVGPYGLGIPGYSPLPEEYVQEAKAQYPPPPIVVQPQTSNWFWRRPRSPSPPRKAAQIETVLEEEEQPAQPEVVVKVGGDGGRVALETIFDDVAKKPSPPPEKTWRAYSLFFPRRPKSPSSATPTLEPSATMDTMISDDLSTAAASLANTSLASGSIWSPDYSGLDETDWVSGGPSSGKKNDGGGRLTKEEMGYPHPQFGHA